MIPAKKTISEIEEGIEREFIDTIQDPEHIQNLVFRLIELTQHEILAIFPTNNTYERYRNEGILQILEKIARERNIAIRILTVKNDKSTQLDSKIRIRYLKRPMQYFVIIMVIDGKFSLSIELKDDLKNNSKQAIGLATYSNSQATVLSFASIFESCFVA